MKQAIVSLKSTCPVYFGRFHNTEKKEKESHDDYETRTWKFRTHVNQDGFVYIPPMMFKNCISGAAKYLGMQIPGKGKSTYTKHFEAGIMVLEPIVTTVTLDDVQGTWLHVPSDGMRGGTKRVMKCFPFVQDWAGDLTIHIFDDTITEDVLEYHIKQAGQFIGVGSFRPRNNGVYGRFAIKDIVVQDCE